MRITFVIALAFLAKSFAVAQQPAIQPVALTIYNQNFAVARTSIDLDLHPGLNEITTTEVTSRLEPDSVILRDPAGKRIVHILEQNYDAALVNQDWLLGKYEGKTIDFEVMTPQGSHIVQGTIIRAPSQSPYEYSPQGQILNGGPAQPLIEVNGKMQFQLPGTPLFPATTDGLLLKPTLRWQIQSEKSEHFSAELAYITGGLDWDATYNVVVPNSTDVTGDEKADVLGWVTIHNLSGTEFPQARIKLMAGDVAKLQAGVGGGMGRNFLKAADAFEAPQVTQKPFDDFHLYDLNRTVTLRDGETKQVQFIDAADVTVHRDYLYDGTAIDQQPYNNFNNGNVNQQRGYGLENGNTKVRIVEQFKNSESNHLGMPLPAGRIRLYRRDADGQMEFTGENTIDHTPRDEVIRVTTGNAFDLVGERRRTNHHLDNGRKFLDESFAIKLRNHKKEAVEIRVVEHLYRWPSWDITEKSQTFAKTDAQIIKFRVEVEPDAEENVTYTVRYGW